MIYLNANGRLDDALSEVTVHGGKIVQFKHAIGPFGIRAIILDTEGKPGGVTLRLSQLTPRRGCIMNILCKLPTTVSVLSISGVLLCGLYAGVQTCCNPR
jgi:hypothetical protein